MKVKFLLWIMAIMLMACKQNTSSTGDNERIEEVETSPTIYQETDEIEEEVPVYNVVDARAFGLSGNVQSVTLQCFRTHDDGGELKENPNPMLEMEIHFNQWGHVTHDEWGNEYEYDAEGHYFRGNHTYTKVKRDDKGRIEEYIDVDSDANYGENMKMSLIYDKQGRLITITRSGSTGHLEEKRIYNGKKREPSKSILSTYDERWGSSETIESYRYSHFDEKGNWTERVKICSSIIPVEDFEGDSVVAKTRTFEEILVEKRTIFYFEYVPFY